MRLTARKSAPGVRGGKVRKKNRTALSPDIYVHEFEDLVICRERPLKGYSHAITRTDVRRFVKLIPDWSEAAAALKAIVLTQGDDWCFGRYHNAGVLKVDAWPKELDQCLPARKRWLLESLGFDLPSDQIGLQVAMSTDQVRCFLLLGTFLHELGHHVDRMTTRSRADAANGEPFAIAYEMRRQRELWPAYLREFGFPEALKGRGGQLVS